jgi:hypothetical protein
MEVAYSFCAIPYSMPNIKKLDKHIIAITKTICKVSKSTPNLATWLPHNLFGIDAFSFKTTYQKCIGKQFRNALNDQGCMGTIYKGLTKILMAKYGGSTTITPITTTSCLHSLTIRTIALLIKNEVQIKNFDLNFHTTCTEIKQQWKYRKHKLTIQQ